MSETCWEVVERLECIPTRDPLSPQGMHVSFGLASRAAFGMIWREKMPRNLPRAGRLGHGQRRLGYFDELRAVHSRAW